VFTVASEGPAFRPRLDSRNQTRWLFGSLHKIFEATMSKLKPEAAYFFPEHGLRSAIMFFDMKDASEIPSIAEPLFAGLNARLQLVPVMNADDLKKGLDIARQAM
jgi:hypothetical protein